MALVITLSHFINVFVRNIKKLRICIRNLIIPYLFLFVNRHINIRKINFFTSIFYIIITGL